MDIRHWFSVGLLAGGLACQPLPAEDSFTIAVIPDAQQETSGTRFNSRMNWLVANRTALNLKAMIQCGDLQNWDTPTHDQYVHQSAGIAILDSANIPYAMCIGNHDTAAVGVGGSAADPTRTRILVRDTSTYNTYYPTTRHTMLKGVYETGKIDNAWHSFTAGDLDWLVLNLELWPRAGAVAWAKTVIAGHPNHNVIVVTHSFLTSGGSIYTGADYGEKSPQYVFDNALKPYANVRMVFCGHVGSHAYKKFTGTNGNGIHAYLQCYHSTTNPTRLITINTRNGTIASRVYDQLNNRDFTDGSTFTVSGVNWVPKVVTTVAPAITTQPVGRTVNAGQTATFTVAATGTPAPTFQWQKNNANISGATAASYTTPATVAGDHGAAFRCIVTNSAGTRTSNAATLTVNVAPAITTQPVAQTRGVGQTATFSVVASGRPAPTFQWQKNGANISGATSASYTTPALTAADQGAQYRCVASNSVGSATSAAAALTVSGIGWQGTYYDNRDFTGARVERRDLAIAFDWGASAPMTGMGVDGFSVRWRGLVTPAHGQTYTFTATCDDGVRVWVGGRKVIDRWTDSSATASAGQVNLTAGVPVLVVMEYYENTGSASATLSWQSASQAAQTIPHTAVVPATGEDLPGGWTAQDVGAVGLAGTTTEAGGTWTLSGSGADIWNGADEFRFVWQQVSGDVRITARVASLTNTNPWSKAGVMVRESLATGSRHAFTCVTPGNGVAFQRRLTADAASSHTAGIYKQAPYWVRVERIGDVLIGSSSPDGATWTEIRRETITLGATVFVGLALTSHDDAALATAGFSDVQITAAGSAAN